LYISKSCGRSQQIQRNTPADVTLTDNSVLDLDGLDLADMGLATAGKGHGITDLQGQAVASGQFRPASLDVLDDSVKLTIVELMDRLEQLRKRQRHAKFLSSFDRIIIPRSTVVVHHSFHT